VNNNSLRDDAARKEKEHPLNSTGWRSAYEVVRKSEQLLGLL